MAASLAGFRYWDLVYDEDGHPIGDGQAQLEDDLPGAGVTDLFLLSHGWNNNAAMARSLYERFVAQMADVLGDAPSTMAVAGVTWPSMRWPDEELPGAAVGGAAGLGDDAGPVADDASIVAALRSVYTRPAEQAALDEVQDLLDRRPADMAALERFQRLLAVLAEGGDVPDAEHDGGEVMLLTADAEAVFDQAADIAPRDFAGGAAGFDAFGRLWSGAKQALRQATYWKMKKRAGVVGSTGVGSLIERLAPHRDGVRLHLIGHSFGARLMSYAVWGLSGAAVAGGSPVKSVALLQGAFSHFAFSPSLPHAPHRRGGLVGVVERIDGPLLATHSESDDALGRLYSWASIVGHDDAAAAASLLYRWGAIGHDGAQHAGAIPERVRRPGESYDFRPGRVHNLDANAVIVRGRGPAGAHNDIFHPELAWAVLDGAGLRS